MTITQTMEIPADRRLIIEVPQEIPMGTIRLEIKLILEEKSELTTKAEQGPVDNSSKGKIRVTKKELENMLDKSPITRELTGILSDLGDITIEQIRDERLSKYWQ